jgi:competence protein ComEC
MLQSVKKFLTGFWSDCRVKARWQYGSLLVLPIIFGCVFHYYNWWMGVLGFTVCLLFFTGFDWKRIGFLSLIFLLWTGWLHLRYPETVQPLELKEISGTARNFSSGSYLKKVVLQTSHGKILVHTQSLDQRIFPGQKVTVFGQMKFIEPPTNPGQFNYAGYLKSQNIHWVFQGDSFQILPGTNLLYRVISSVRLFLEEGLEASVAPEVLPLVKAALLGTRHLLSNDLRENFADSGMFHLLAISGLHVGIIAVILLQMCSFLRIPRKWAYCFSGILLILYIPVTGASISVIRAVTMFGCLVITVLMERSRFTLNNLAITCIICLVFMPYQILSLGFQLSFCATFFLLYYSRTITDFLIRFNIRNSLMRAVFSTVLVSGLLFFATLPFLAYTIHQVSPLAILGNILTIFLTSVMVLTGALTIALYPIADFLAAWMGETCSLVAGLLMYSVERLSDLQWSRVFMPSLSWTQAGLIFSFLLLLPYAISRKCARAMFLVYVLVFSAWLACSQVIQHTFETARITFLDVGQGDAAVCQLPGDYNVLIDAGQGTRRSGRGRYAILPYLKQEGINELDLVIVTHGDLDHFGGLLYLIPRIEIGRVVYSGDSATSRSWSYMLNDLKKHNIPLQQVLCGDSLYIHPRLSLSVVSPCQEGQFGGRNNNSVVVVLKTHREKIFFAGDIEKQAEHWIASFFNTDMDILKVSHHGSATATTPAFLKAVTPEIGIISAGKDNRFDMPHAEVLERLKEHNVKLYSTIRSGAVSLVSNRFKSRWEVTVSEL